MVALPESPEECAGDVVPLGGHGLELSGRFLERYVDDAVAVERGHAAEAPLVGEVGGLQSEARREDAVTGSRRPAALNVPEDGDPRLEPCALFDVMGERPADAPEDDVPELVALASFVGDEAAARPTRRSARSPR